MRKSNFSTGEIEISTEVEKKAKRFFFQTELKLNESNVYKNDSGKG